MWLQGETNHVFTLFWSMHGTHASALAARLGIDEPAMVAHLSELHDHRAISQINFWAMPVQDAIDLAVFAAKVEINMERFCAGEPVCGGPIDLMTLEMGPSVKIRSFPGKALHHPDLARPQ
jgi:hypothetical protein